MKLALPLIAAASLTLGGIGAVAFAQAPAVPAPAPAKPAPPPAKPAPASDMWANVHWDDQDGPRRAGPMPKLNSEALRRAGIVKVREVERDDNRIEVEGWDAQGHEVEVKMDSSGQRVLRVKVDRDDD